MICMYTIYVSILYIQYVYPVYTLSMHGIYRRLPGVTGVVCHQVPAELWPSLPGLIPLPGLQTVDIPILPSLACTPPWLFSEDILLTRCI